MSTRKTSQMKGIYFIKCVHKMPTTILSVMIDLSVIQVCSALESHFFELQGNVYLKKQ
jgi:hypothetical protein